MEENKIFNDQEDELIDYDTFLKQVNGETDINKNRLLREFKTMGDDLLFELDEKKRIEEIEKKKLIDYIIKHKNRYSPQILLQYSYEDVRNIYNEIKEHRNILGRFLKFIFG